MSDLDAQIRGNLNAMRRSHGLPESAGPSLPAQQWWVDDLAERQAELEDAKRSLRRSAMAMPHVCTCGAWFEGCGYPPANQVPL